MQGVQTNPLRGRVLGAWLRIRVPTRSATVEALNTWPSAPQGKLDCHGLKPRWAGVGADWEGDSHTQGNTAQRVRRIYLRPHRSR